jgi:hypothetical protein
MDRTNAKSSGEKAVVRSVDAGADGNQVDEIMKVIQVPRNEHQKCRERPQVWQPFQLRARELLQRRNLLRARHRLHEWYVKRQSYSPLLLSLKTWLRRLHLPVVRLRCA